MLKRLFFSFLKTKKLAIGLDTPVSSKPPWAVVRCYLKQTRGKEKVRRQIITQGEGRFREVVITAKKTLSQVGPPGVLGQARLLLLPLCHKMRRIETEKHPLC